jgi:hypothetical protein
LRKWLLSFIAVILASIVIVSANATYTVWGTELIADATSGDAVINTAYQCIGEFDWTWANCAVGYGGFCQIVVELEYIADCNVILCGSILDSESDGYVCIGVWVSNDYDYWECIQYCDLATTGWWDSIDVGTPQEL